MSPPFAIRDLGEVALAVRDLPRMFAFYRDKLGLEVLRAPENGNAFFRLAPGHAQHTRILALFEVAEDDPRLGGPHHFALNVNFADQEAARDWLADRGIDTRWQIFGWVGWRGLFLSDPEGNAVELVAFDRSLLSPGG